MAVFLKNPWSEIAGHWNFGKTTDIFLEFVTLWRKYPKSLLFDHWFEKFFGKAVVVFNIFFFFHNYMHNI